MRITSDGRIPNSRKWLWLATSLSLCLCLAFSGVLNALALSPFIKTTQDVELGNLRGVTDSWVIKDGATYKMWFSHPKTEVTQSQVAGLISGLGLDAILEALKNQDMPALLEHVSGLDAGTVYNLLKDTATVIGYATSTDGINWTVQDPEVLSAPAENELQSVAAPCVIYNGSEYEMWYSRSTTGFSQAEIAELLSDLGSADDQIVADAIVNIINGNRTVIDYATSSDGIGWTLDAAAVLENTGPYLGDNAGAPCVLFDGAGYRMWFSSVSTGITQTMIEDLAADLENIAPEDLWDLQAGLVGSIGYAESADGAVWTGVDYNIFSKGAGLLNAVTAPCVITDGVEYQMWYTYGVTGFSRDDISPILDELNTIDIDYLLELLETEDYDTLIEEFVEIIDNNLFETKSRLDGTTTRIGYASSANGTDSWTENSAYGLNPASDTPWASVARPCVIRTGEFYQMWFTRGVDELTAQNLLDLWQGTICTIGYASTGEIIELVAGWNFVGLPLNPVPPDTDQVLSDISGSIQTVWAYDAATGLWRYYTTIPGAPQGSLLEMETGTGYWIELISPATLSVFGEEPGYPFEIALVAGWNLVSIPKTPIPSNTEAVLGDILDNVQTVWAYDAATGMWSYYTTIQGAPQGELTNMTESKAYWIEMTAADTLIIG